MSRGSRFGTALPEHLHPADELTCETPDLIETRTVGSRVIYERYGRMPRR